MGIWTKERCVEQYQAIATSKAQLAKLKTNKANERTKA